MAEQLALFAPTPPPASPPVKPTDEIVDLGATAAAEVQAVQRELLALLTVPAAIGEPWVDWADIFDWLCSSYGTGCNWHIGRFLGGRSDLPISEPGFKARVLAPLLRSGVIVERPRYFTSKDPRDPDYAGWHPQFALMEAQQP